MFHFILFHIVSHYTFRINDSHCNTETFIKQIKDENWNS